MKSLLLVTTLTAVLVNPPPALAAGTQSPLVDRREHHQVQRLKQGVRSGALTGQEALRSAKDQVQIRRQERRFKADGHLNVRERAQLHRELNQSSHRLYRRKHNSRIR